MFFSRILHELQNPDGDLPGGLEARAREARPTGKGQDLTGREESYSWIGTIPIKGNDLRRNPIICLLVAGLLIVSLTGQAAAAFRMACEGTAACCCRNMAAMPDTGSDMAPMDGGCCDIPAPQPCDLAGPVSIPATPFLPTETNIESEIPGLFADAIPMASPAIEGRASGRIPIGPPTLAGPPVYLLTQTFLC